MTETLQLVIMAMSLFLNFASICTICYAFFKFINKPRTNLEQRVTIIEAKVKEIDYSLKHGNDKFREQRETNELFFTVILAFVDFEIAYCYNTGYDKSSDLVKAKDLIQQYLAKKGGGKDD